jgi:hypothetical protein
MNSKNKSNSMAAPAGSVDAGGAVPDERRAQLIRNDLEVVESCMQDCEPSDQQSFYNLRALILAYLHAQKSALAELAERPCRARVAIKAGVAQNSEDLANKAEQQSAQADRAARIEAERNRNIAMLASRLAADHGKAIRAMFCNGTPTGRMLVDCIAGAAPVAQEVEQPHNPVPRVGGDGESLDTLEFAQVLGELLRADRLRTINGATADVGWLAAKEALVTHITDWSDRRVAVARRDALEEAADACMRATPDRAKVRAIGEAAHYSACRDAIRSLSAAAADSPTDNSQGGA